MVLKYLKFGVLTKALSITGGLFFILFLQKWFGKEAVYIYGISVIYSSMVQLFECNYGATLIPDLTKKNILKLNSILSAISNSFLFAILVSFVIGIIFLIYRDKLPIYINNYIVFYFITNGMISFFQATIHKVRIGIENDISNNLIVATQQFGSLVILIISHQFGIKLGLMFIFIALLFIIINIFNYLNLRFLLIKKLKNSDELKRNFDFKFLTLKNLLLGFISNLSYAINTQADKLFLVNLPNSMSSFYLHEKISGSLVLSSFYSTSTWKRVSRATFLTDKGKRVAFFKKNYFNSILIAIFSAILVFLAIIIYDFYFLKEGLSNLTSAIAWSFWVIAVTSYNSANIMAQSCKLYFIFTISQFIFAFLSILVKLSILHSLSELSLILINASLLFSISMAVLARTYKKLISAA